MWRRWPEILAAPVAAAALLVAGCQPVPQPFLADDPASAFPLSRPTGQSGVLVRAVTGAPDAIGLAQEVAKALQAQEVAAATGSANRESRLLTSRAEARPMPGSRDRLALRIEWFVNDPSGKAVGRHVQTADVAAAAWASGEAHLKAQLAHAAATALAPLLGGDAALPPPRTLVVHEVLGAPGDGNVSLRRALAHRLSQKGYTLADDVADGDVVLSATVRLTPRGPVGDDIAITWTALGPDGGVLGAVEQRNRVPAGSLSGAWGVTAVHAAAAAVPGIVDLLERTRKPAPKAAGSAASTVASPPGG